MVELINLMLFIIYRTFRTTRIYRFFFTIVNFCSIEKVYNKCKNVLVFTYFFKLTE